MTARSMPSVHEMGLESEQQLMSPSQLLPTAQPGLLAYPMALAKHHQIVADRDLFYDTLNKFHAALGTRLMIPTIGGKELDLHLLYVEVSVRGGLEQVIKDRKWKDVTVVFNFPPTTTSASYVLRKYYMTLLHHYEQVYFFGAQGQLVPPPAPLLTTSLGQPSGDNGLANHGSEVGEPVVKKRRRRVKVDPTQLYGVDLGASVGQMVSGVIDGKFEHGYLVTIAVGTEKLKGVLYHMPSGSLGPQFAAIPGMASGIGFDSMIDVRRRRRRRRKDEMPKKDPHAPKPNRSGYNFFFQEQHMRLKALYPDKDKEISRMIGESWNKQTGEERAVYQELGVKDKERYKKEMALYRERLEMQTQCEDGEVGRLNFVMQPVIDPEKDVDKGPDEALGIVDVGSFPMVIEQHVTRHHAFEEKDLELNNKSEEQVSLACMHDQAGNG